MIRVLHATKKLKSFHGLNPHHLKMQVRVSATLSSSTNYDSEKEHSWGNLPRVSMLHIAGKRSYHFIDFGNFKDNEPKKGTAHKPEVRDHSGVQESDGNPHKQEEILRWLVKQVEQLEETLRDLEKLKEEERNHSGGQAKNESDENPDKQEEKNHSGGQEKNESRGNPMEFVKFFKLSDGITNKISVLSFIYGKALSLGTSLATAHTLWGLMVGEIDIPTVYEAVKDVLLRLGSHDVQFAKQLEKLEEILREIEGLKEEVKKLTTPTTVTAGRPWWKFW